MQTFDKIFKVCILCLGLAFIILYAISMDNGRYQFGKFGDDECVRDTRTADIYRAVGGVVGQRYRTSWVRVNFKRHETESLDAAPMEK